MKITLHPWINAGWVQEDNVKIYFTTDEVAGFMQNDAKRIQHIRENFPGIIEQAEEKLQETIRLLTVPRTP